MPNAVPDAASALQDEVRSMLRAFNPDEARAPDGKFSSGAGSAAPTKADGKRALDAVAPGRDDHNRLALVDVHKTGGKGFALHFPKSVDEMLKAGVVERDGDRLKVTPLGKRAMEHFTDGRKALAASDAPSPKAAAPKPAPVVPAPAAKPAVPAPKPAPARPRDLVREANAAEDEAAKATDRANAATDAAMAKGRGWDGHPTLHDVAAKAHDEAEAAHRRVAEAWRAAAAEAAASPLAANHLAAKSMLLSASDSERNADDHSEVASWHREETGGTSHGPGRDDEDSRPAHVYLRAADANGEQRMISNEAADQAAQDRESTVDALMDTFLPEMPRLLAVKPGPATVTPTDAIASAVGSAWANGAQAAGRADVVPPLGTMERLLALHLGADWRDEQQINVTPAMVRGALLAAYEAGKRGDTMSDEQRGTDAAKALGEEIRAMLRPERRAADDGGDGHWVTMQGTHVFIGGDGTITKGPATMAGHAPDELPPRGSASHEEAAAKHQDAASASSELAGSHLNLARKAAAKGDRQGEAEHKAKEMALRAEAQRHREAAYHELADGAHAASMKAAREAGKPHDFGGDGVSIVHSAAAFAAHNAAAAAARAAGNERAAAYHDQVAKEHRGTIGRAADAAKDALARLGIVKGEQRAFNPDQERDDHGRWKGGTMTLGNGASYHIETGADGRSNVLYKPPGSHVMSSISPRAGDGTVREAKARAETHAINNHPDHLPGTATGGGRGARPKSIDVGGVAHGVKWDGDAFHVTRPGLRGALVHGRVDASGKVSQAQGWRHAHGHSKDLITDGDEKEAVAALEKHTAGGGGEKRAEAKETDMPNGTEKRSCVCRGEGCVNCMGDRLGVTRSDIRSSAPEVRASDRLGGLAAAVFGRHVDIGTLGAVDPRGEILRRRSETRAGDQARDEHGRFAAGAATAKAAVAEAHAKDDPGPSSFTAAAKAHNAAAAAHERAASLSAGANRADDASAHQNAAEEHRKAAKYYAAAAAGTGSAESAHMQSNKAVTAGNAASSHPSDGKPHMDAMAATARANEATRTANASGTRADHDEAAKLHMEAARAHEAAGTESNMAQRHRWRADDHENAAARNRGKPTGIYEVRSDVDMSDEEREARDAGDGDGRWVTMQGTHVFIDGDGTITKGPKTMTGHSPDELPPRGYGSHAEAAASHRAAAAAAESDAGKHDRLAATAHAAGDINNEAFHRQQATNARTAVAKHRMAAYGVLAHAAHAASYQAAKAAGKPHDFGAQGVAVVHSKEAAEAHKAAAQAARENGDERSAAYHEQVAKEHRGIAGRVADAAKGALARLGIVKGEKRDEDDMGDGDGDGDEGEEERAADDAEDDDREEDVDQGVDVDDVARRVQAEIRSMIKR